MDVGATFISNTKSSELMQPGERALHDPAQLSQPAIIISSASWQQRLDALHVKHHFSEVRVVRLVGDDRIGPPPRSANFAAYWRDCVDQFKQLRAVADVRRRDRCDQRDAARLRNDMVFRARFSAIRWVRAGVFTPPTARSDAESTTARDQSMRSAAWRCASSVSWSCCQTPAACQSRNRRQQVIPQPHPISCGSISHWMPVVRTKRMPVKHARSGVGFRPGLRVRRGLAGMMGSMSAHKRSSTSGLAMRASLHAWKEASRMPFC